MQWQKNLPGDLKERIIKIVLEQRAKQFFMDQSCQVLCQIQSVDPVKTPILQILATRDDILRLEVRHHDHLSMLRMLRLFNYCLNAKNFLKALPPQLKSVADEVKEWLPIALDAIQHDYVDEQGFVRKKPITYNKDKENPFKTLWKNYQKNHEKKAGWEMNYDDFKEMCKYSRVKMMDYLYRDPSVVGLLAQMGEMGNPFRKQSFRLALERLAEITNRQKIQIKREFYTFMKRQYLEVYKCFYDSNLLNDEFQTKAAEETILKLWRSRCL